MDSLWPSLAAELKKELPAQQFDTWIKPLRAERNGEQLLLLAPNHHVLRWVRSNLLTKIETRIERVAGARLSVNLILDENKKPGTKDWMLSKTAVDPKTKYRAIGIEGYVSHSTIAAGETLTFAPLIRIVSDMSSSTVKMRKI